MKKENVILEKSFKFAIKVIEFYRYLCDSKKEYVLSKQLLRSGTSIGANVNEAQAAQSKNDFISKMSIASKEARETKYWLDLLIATGYMNLDRMDTRFLSEEVDNIINLLTKIVKTGRKNETH